VIDSVLEKPLRRERLRRTLMMAQEA